VKLVCRAAASKQIKDWVDGSLRRISGFFKVCPDNTKLHN
jgi:hypothetical protein